MTKRTWVCLTFVVCFSLPFLIHHLSVKRDLLTQKDDWHTLKKDPQTQEISLAPTTPEEKAKNALPSPSPMTSSPEVNQARVPATQDDHANQNSEEKQQQTQWKKNLGQNLLSSYPTGTKVFLKEEGSYLDIFKSMGPQDDKGQLVKKAVITTLFPDGKKISFKALVDTNSGKILSSWDQSRDEIKTPPSIKF